MSDEQSIGSPAEGALQFDHAEPTHEAAGWSCAMCGNPLVNQYYDANGKSLCGDCRLRLETALKARPGAMGFLKSLVAGIGAGVLGAAIYYAVRAATGFELSLIAILVGWLVGKAVRWGTGGKGGRAYQVLAVFLTYMSIVSSYIPMILQQVNEHAAKSRTVAAPADPGGKAAASPAQAPSTRRPSLGGFLLSWLFLLGFVAALPFLAGIKNALGIVIIGIGVWQAWKLNQPPSLTLAGPFEIRDHPAAALKPT